MSLPTNITKEHLLKAIEKIDKEGIPIDAHSHYYDVIFNEKQYPPKLIVSYANLYANGQILDRDKFEGGLGTQCFKLLEEKGFKIIKKLSNITQKIKQFSNSFKKEVENKYSGDLLSYKILVKELPDEIKNNISLLGNFTVKGSIGVGNNTYYPWIGIFDSRVSTGATNGFYVVLLFSDDFEDLYLTLNQGSTIQTKEQTEAYRNFIYTKYDTIEGFNKGRIPEGGLVKTKTGSATKNGKKYEETNIFYRQYKVADLNEDDFIRNLQNIVKIYFDCVNQYIIKESDLNLGKNIEIPIDLSHAKLKNTVMNFEYKDFYNSIVNSGLKLDEFRTLRFISSLLTKPFVILTGLSGSGKTKLAQAFAMWICENENQYCIVPVGADWTNREPLLGFPNSLEVGKYVKPDNRVLDLIIDAIKNPNKPHFLILDEMNLSHVERYFADFLSAMETKGKVSLHTGSEEWNGVPSEIHFPANLFIIGTVNIDETTYMFSPKVLDRANVIEFRITAQEMKSYLSGTAILDLESLKSVGSNMAGAFMEIAKDKSFQTYNDADIQSTLMIIFSELKKIGAEFGYRAASEIHRFAAVVNIADPNSTMTQIIDAAIMQKLLPKVHGSRRKLEPVLKTLGTLCLHNSHSIDEFISYKTEINFDDTAKIKYPISLEKILRMYDGLINNGFTSYAEA